MHTPTELLAALLERIDRELPLAVELRHRLHEHAESAHQEHGTAQLLIEHLPVACERAAGTGVLALAGDEHSARRTGAAERAAVGVRAELDGLPLHERTGAPWSARGEVMHACGHDVHMAALVALLRAAHQLAGERALPAALLGIFQPSEEAYPSGAEQLARGELAGRRLAAVVAAHVHPEIPWGTLALDPGVVNASCDNFELLVIGEPAHSAYPQHARDPILALSQTVLALHALAPARADPLHPALLGVGIVRGGTAENMIPGSASARGTIRAYRAEDRRQLRELLRETARGIAETHGCSVEVRLQEGEPPLENDRAIVAGARALLEDAALAPGPEWRSCGSDDFSFLAAIAPLAMGFVGLAGAPGFEPRPLHHPELLVPDEAVAAVARAQACLYVAATA